MPFEFIDIPAPKGYDDILHTQYGDYMQPVRGGNCHGSVIIDPERPYTEYLR